MDIFNLVWCILATWTQQLVALTVKVLTEFEIGQAMAAIEGVARLAKPIAEVGCRIVELKELEEDLLACVASAGESDQVRPWIRQAGQHLRFGYYGEPWALDALDFLERADLDPTDRYWISGLLFGYRPQAIQRFIARSGDGEASARSTNHMPSTVETAHSL